MSTKVVIRSQWLNHITWHYLQKLVWLQVTGNSRKWLLVGYPCWLKQTPISKLWRHQMETFSALLAICVGNSPHKSQWGGGLRWCFLWSAPWINGWVDNREAGDLRRHRAHYDAIVMNLCICYTSIEYISLMFPKMVSKYQCYCYMP